MKQSTKIVLMLLVITMFFFIGLSTGYPFLSRLASIVYAQTPQAYTPTPDQALQMQLMNADVQKTQAELQIAAEKLPEYAAFQKAVDARDKKAESIQKENKWPDTVKFNSQVGTWYDTKPPAPPKESEKK
jgi:ATP-dependent exoDNAse (exonuclease V) beta subunit